MTHTHTHTHTPPDDRLTFSVKKEGFGGGGTRQLQFNNTGQGDCAFVKPSGKTLNVTVGPGLPPNTSEYIQTLSRPVF